MDETKNMSAMNDRTSNIKDKKKGFENIVSQYLDSNPSLSSGHISNELEIRFGTNYRLRRPITKIDYDNVIKQLYSCGFKIENPNGNQMLRVQTEYIDPRTGSTKMSNIRAEIVGSDLIQKYCETNDIKKVIDMPSTLFNKIKFTRKASAKDKNDQYIQKLDMEDFNFRVSYQVEQDFHTQTNIARNIISKWNDSKKIFRSMNRVRFYHDEYPVYADLTIVKSSKKSNHVPIPRYTIQEAEVFENIESYEIELEIDNSKVGIGTKFSDVKHLMNDLRKTIRIVLSGLQGTRFPVPYSEVDNTLQSYMKMIHGEEYGKRRVLNKDFIGPSSYTLQMDNIMENKDEDEKMINILNNYTVTDKADGERRLLYINGEGKIYMIDMNMNVIFTGTHTLDKSHHNSLLDGEHIKYDKNENYINLFAVFDVYYVNGKSTREYPFYKDLVLDNENDNNQQKQGNENKKDNNSRLHIMRDFVDRMSVYSILDKTTDNEVKPKQMEKNAGFRIQVKNFFAKESIFSACSELLSKMNDGTYEYNTDGLIFTPALLPVAGNEEGGEPGPLFKTTWSHSFKWKPPAFNTIDFLVSVKKDSSGRDDIHNIYQDGINLNGKPNLTQYKTLILRCGFDEKKHGFVNPCQNIIDDNLPSGNNIDLDEGYKPVPFQPTNPYDDKAQFCNIVLKEQGSNLVMMTEEGEYFEENTIIEFKYELSNKEGWKWVPLRVRHDKTADLKSGQKNYGNAYHVANSNWHSIQNPITEEMISSGKNIPDFIEDNEVYYNKSGKETSTQGLRDFHNLYVKKNLILSVSERGHTLIDYAVGKAGDLSKWTKSKLKFVYGIDVSKDNINNQLDGACARYLKASKKQDRIPKALFVTGNSSLNIRKGNAFSDDKNKLINSAVFGNGPKDVDVLGKGVYKQYGVGESGFNISSCQFATHYFFENKETFNEFLRNISECTKINGYFIGTCYDGKTVFNKLSDKKKDESMSIMKGDRKIYEITKMYDETGFPDEESSLGYPIGVFQESINKTFKEYLVNFNYFVRMMDNYGFVLLETEEAKNLGLPDGSGLFAELFAQMEEEIKQFPSKKADYKDALYMSAEEKKISFMNRYFVFKKMRNVDMNKFNELITQKEKELSERIEEVETEIFQDKIEEPITTVVDNPPPEKKKAIRKTKKKVIIN